MSENEKKELTDEQIMFPEVKVTLKYTDGKEKEVEVKPWSFGELVEINPILEEIFKQMEARGTSIDLADFGFGTLKDVYFSALPQIGKVIAKTVGIKEEELSKMTVDSILTAAVTIFTANKESFSNFFGLFFGQMTGPESTEEPKTS